MPVPTAIRLGISRQTQCKVNIFSRLDLGLNLCPARAYAILNERISVQPRKLDQKGYLANIYVRTNDDQAWYIKANLMY
jgi:hypothetical protein